MYIYIYVLKAHHHHITTTSTQLPTPHQQTNKQTNMQNSTPDPQRDLVAPALAGVENVLGAVQKAMTMDAGAGAGKGKKTKGPRVVLTSSTGASCVFFCVSCFWCGVSV